jgi:hypothetical protein
MKRSFLGLLAAAVLLAAGPVHAAGEDPEARYQAMVAKAKAGDGPVDWAALRFAYADRPKPPSEPQDARKQLAAAIGRKDYDDALARANALIEADYADGEAHIAASIAHRGLDHAADADRERAIGVAIFKSMMTGDGLTPASAYTVVAVAEEYQLMAVLGRRVTMQALTYAGGHGYDVLTTVGQNGDQTAYYFQIDRVLEAERKLFDGVK